MSSFTTIQVWAELRGIGKIFLRKNIWLFKDISSSEILVIVKSFSTSDYHSYNRPWGLNWIFNFSNYLIIFQKKVWTAYLTILSILTRESWKIDFYIEK